MAENNSSKEQTKKAVWAGLDGIIEGLVGMVPGVGPLLQSAIYQLPQRLAAIRLEAYVNDLADRINEVETTRNLDFPRPVDDSIRDIFVEVARCPYEENRKYFIEMFIKVAEQKEDDVGLWRNYPEIIRLLTPLQIQLLKNYLKSMYWLEYKRAQKDQDVDIKKIDWDDENRLFKVYGVKTKELKAAIDDLISKGLMIDDGPGRWNTGSTREFLKVTTLATSLLEYVISDQELAEMRALAQEGDTIDDQL